MATERYTYFSHLEKPQISQLQASPDAVFFAARDGWFLIDHKTTENLMANKKGSKKRARSLIHGAAGAGKSFRPLFFPQAEDVRLKKTLTPRTKREQQIADEARHKGFEDGHERGYASGKHAGAEAERRHSEELLCRVVKSFSDKS